MAIGATELIEQFKAEAIRTGAVVYEAKDAEDASNYVLKLAQERNVKHVVKSKSHLAVDVRLREQFEKSGIEVTETDLGEWIAQLARGRSANDASQAQGIEQVAELVSKATGEKLEPDPQAVLNAARHTFRQACIKADMGISEASIGIAETGTLVIISNEGNARLVAVLPVLHATLIDCEKLVPAMEDATANLQSLNQSSTSWEMPSYVTYITGRNTTGDIPGALMARAQGPEEEHIVLVNKAVGKRE